MQPISAIASRENFFKRQHSSNSGTGASRTNYFNPTPFQNTFMFRHVIVPEKTAPGKSQRPPEELLNLQKYEVIQELNQIPPPPVKMILLEDVEGVIVHS